MGDLSKFFGLAFSALLPLVNPLGDALVFLGLVGSAPPLFIGNRREGLQPAQRFS
jgi:hypothetical protein